MESEDGADDHTREATHSPMSTTDQDAQSDGRHEAGEGNMSSDGETEKSGSHCKYYIPRCSVWVVERTNGNLRLAVRCIPLQVVADIRRLDP